VVRQAPVRQVQLAVHPDVGEEALVVAHHDQRAAVRVERLHELPGADDVEVVRGLVEQQELRGGLGEQHAGQRRAQPLTTRERGDGQVGPGAAEQEPGEQAHPVGRRQPHRVARQVLQDGAVVVEQVEPLREVGDAPAAAPDPAAVGQPHTLHDPQQRRFAGAVGAGQRDAFGAADREVDPVAREQRAAVDERLQVLALEHGASGRHGRARQLDADHVVVAQGALGVVEAGAGGADPVRVHAVGAGRGVLRLALHVAGEDLREAGVGDAAGGVAGAAGRALTSLLHLPLLPLELLLGVPDGAFGDGLLGGHGFLVGGEVAAVEGEPVGPQLGDAVHPVEQRAVVADHERHAAPPVEHLVQAVARVGVEVVGGLVEQQHVGLLQQLGGQPERDDLAAAEGVEPAVQRDIAEAEPVELVAGAVLDVPVGADRGEVLLRRVASLDGGQRAQHRRHTEHLRHGEVAGQRQLLGQVAEHTVHGDRAGSGRQQAGDQPQQGRLPGPVGGDQTGAAGADGEREVLDDHGAVGPGEGQVGADDGRVGHDGISRKTAARGATGSGHDNGTARAQRAVGRSGSPGDVVVHHHGDLLFPRPDDSKSISRRSQR
jgi:hypothetical protein